MSAITPTETDLPNIISVDDHVLEPRDLWQQELPPSLRERGPASSREKVSLEFTGGHYGFDRDDPDGHWCDLWLFDDLVMPTGLLHAPAGVPRRGAARTSPPSTRTSAPAPTTRRRASPTWTTTTSRSSINYPNTFPRFAGQGFAERADKDLALACLQIYNDWMIDEWCGGDGARAASSRSRSCRCGTRSSPPRRCGAARRRAATPSRSARTRPSSASPRCTRGDWDVLWDACAGDRHDGVDAHRLVVDRCRPRRPTRRWPTSMSLNAQNAEGSLCDWVFSRHARALPRPEDRLRREPGRLDAVPARAHGHRVARRRRRRRAREPPPSEYVHGPGLRLHLRRPARAAAAATSVGARARSCSRPTTRTPTARGPNSRAVAHRLCAGAGMDAEECYAVPARQRHPCYGLERFGITA